MSLQSAAAGFGVWCEKNNVKFNVSLLGNISIGAKREEVMRIMARTCQRRVDIEYKGRETIYKDDTGDVLSFSVIGTYVSGFKFNGAAYQIPQNMIYRYKDKYYLSNICIEGYMIWIKNLDEIKLKPVKDIPCISMTLADVGGKIEHVGKGNITRFLEAEAKVKRVSKNSKSVAKDCSGYLDTLEKQKQVLEKDIRDLEIRVNGLKDKVYESREFSYN